mmetsp:Transcript_11064/g.7699  ORF Transcript_11064/g.7699 Transcript_11064/m.7699 type:complete len:308 (-) Transcript_11064:61-984(-)
MGIHNNLVNIIISEHTVPTGAVVESVVENEGNLRGFLLDHGSGVLIEFNQCISRGVPPWLVDWLKSVESRVRTPSIEELADIVKSPVDVILVNVVIRVSIDIPVTDPVGGLDLPMAEVVVIKPLESQSLARVIETVLGILKTVNIKKDLEVVLLSGIKKPLNFVSSTISATFIRSIGLKSPVTNRKTKNLNTTVSEAGNIALSYPVVPMVSENLVTPIRSELLTEGVLVNTDTIFLGVSKESVEEGRSNPRFEYLPSTDVGTNHGLGSNSGYQSGKSHRCSHLLCVYLLNTIIRYLNDSPIYVPLDP